MQIYKYVIKISKFADMKKITTIFILLLTVFSSCETELDINAEWEEIMVVYGLLDQSQEKQYIRINKAFLGEESAYLMASVADSLNFNPNNIEVKLDKVSNFGVVLDTKILTDTIMYKEDGTFASENNIIYTFDTDNFLNQEKEYVLTITNLTTGDVVSGSTKLIYELELMAFFDNPAYKMGFYSHTGDFSNTTVEWSPSKNAGIYQMKMILNYTEYGPIDTVVKQIEKTYPIINYDGSGEVKQSIKGESFFNFIAYNIEKDNSVNRRINNIDLLFSAGGNNLNTYMNLNEPPTGIVQERPIYTNITDGYGLFSCRYNKIQENILITTTTKEAIANHLDSLNFIYP